MTPDHLPGVRNMAAQPATIWQWLTSDGNRIGERWQAINARWDGENGRAGLEAAALAAMRADGAAAPVAQGSASLATLQGEAQVLRALLADALPWFDEAAADQPDPEALPHLQALRDRIRAALAPTPGTLL
ncbi:MAG: hypothetical protein ACOVPA_07780 [Rubrivivax sp.]|jgi:hypothetical protein